MLRGQMWCGGGAGENIAQLVKIYTHLPRLCNILGYQRVVAQHSGCPSVVQLGGWSICWVGIQYGGQSGGVVLVRDVQTVKLFAELVLIVFAGVDDMSTYGHYFKYKPLYKGASLGVVGAMCLYV